ncbi:MAG: SpoIIE family protein phosphatase [Longicatena sp.]
MEKTISRKLRSRYFIQVNDIICAGCAILLGSIASPIAYVFTFIYVSYSYFRSTREAFVSIFFILLCALGRGIVPAYFYALGLTSYFLVIYIIKACNKNVYQWMPYIVTIIAIIFCAQTYGLEAKSLVLPIASFLMMQEMFRDFDWIKQDYVFTKCIFGLLVFSIGVLGSELFPLYTHIILMLTLLAIAYGTDEKITFILTMVGTYFIQNVGFEILIFVMLISILKADKKALFLCMVGSYFIIEGTLLNYGYISLALMGVFLVKEHDKTIEKPMLEERYSQQSVLKRQMQNYANIFQTLAEYYTHINDVQADILANMATALQYNADVVRKIDGIQKDVSRLQKALEGYQYDVKELAIEEPREGCIQITLRITNIRRGEIRTTLLPLLEVLLHRNLRVEEIQSKRFMKGYHHICIADYVPFEIHSYADSIKNSYTSSGDTFSIFKFRQSDVCMISDGMGNGARALQSSRLITNIFQRMMVSGIPQDAAIKCINKLVQSDTYATLDVVCFNRAQGVAYISKSAACPTFLLRQGEIHEINGNALPVGIVSQMQPDCFQIDLKAGDEYLMVSDGVTRNEIYDWLKKRKKHSIKEDVEIFAEILQTKQRMDDSTVVLASVDEIK